MSDYHNLLVWKKAFEFAKLTYRLTKIFPKEELYGLNSQLRRAAVSVFANIAEGRGKRTDKDFLRFLYNANGSLFECEGYFEFARDLQYINNEQYKFIEDKRKEVGYLLNRFMNSLEK